MITVLETRKEHVLIVDVLSKTSTTLRTAESIRFVSIFQDMMPTEESRCRAGPSPNRIGNVWHCRMYTQVGPTLGLTVHRFKFHALGFAGQFFRASRPEW